MPTEGHACLKVGVINIRVPQLPTNRYYVADATFVSRLLHVCRHPLMVNPSSHRGGRPLKMPLQFSKFLHGFFENNCVEYNFPLCYLYDF